MPTSLTPTLRSSSSRGALPSTRHAVVAVGVLCVLGAGLRAEPPCATRLAIEPSPNPEDADVARLYAVTVLAPDDIWAVGLWRACTDCAPFENTQEYSLVMHYDGSAWAVAPSPSPVNPVGDARVSLADVDAVSPDLIYAAGSYNFSTILSPDTFVLRWDGSSWSQLASPGQSGFGASGYLLEAVHAVNAENVWFGGQFPGPYIGVTDPIPVAMRYDGNDFEVMPLPRIPTVIAAHRVRAMDASGADDVWAVGAAGGGGVAVGVNYVARWDGSSWAHMPTPSPGFGENLYAVAALAPDDVWAAGRYQHVVDGMVVTEPMYLHWDGGDWTVHEGPAFANDLIALGPDDIYGVGGAAVVHWDGESWSLAAPLIPDPPGGFVNLLGVDAVDPCSLVATGMTSFGATDNTTLVARIDGASGLLGDIDGDGDVDVADLAALLADWGDCPGCPADLDGDGVVGVLDLATLLASWT